MKTMKLICTGFLLIGLQCAYAQTSESTDLSVLEGTWKLDMSPQNEKDSNFAKMKITKASIDGLEGEFYRDGVPMQMGKVNTQLGIIYAALVSGDNSGTYNTTFYYKYGRLYGTTHAIDKDFLSVWIATRVK